MGLPRIQNVQQLFLISRSEFASLCPQCVKWTRTSSLPTHFLLPLLYDSLTFLTTSLCFLFISSFLYFALRYSINIPSIIGNKGPKKHSNKRSFVSVVALFAHFLTAIRHSSHLLWLIPSPRFPNQPFNINSPTIQHQHRPTPVFLTVFISWFV